MMEQLILKYRILFNLQFDLSGFKNDLNQYLTVSPDEKTKELISWYRTLTKKQKSTSTYLIETEFEGLDDGKAKVSLENNEKFTYQVKIKSEDFLKNTNISHYDFVNKVLFVSNTTVNKPGGELLLSQPLESYSASNEYKRGYLATSGGLNYKALLPSNNLDSHVVTETDFWKPIIKIGVSQADLVDRTSLVVPPDLDTLMVIDIQNDLTIDVDYRLLDGSLKMTEVNYMIRFQNAN